MAAALAILIAAATISTAVIAQDAPAKPAKDEPAAKDNAATAEVIPFLRVAEKPGKSITLEIASRDYLPRGGEGPTVTLVGVAHIGERAFYRGIQKELAEYDLVLYESVLPAGAKGAAGGTDDERIAGTEAAMGFVGGLVETFHDARETYPDDLAHVREFATRLDARLGHWLDNASRDGWGRKLTYERREEGAAYGLISLGRDGKPGGEGPDADIDLADLPPPVSMAGEDEDDNIQAQLADALRLEFQLFALDYGLDNWRCSDMAMDQVDRALAERGVEFELVSGALAGTSIFAQVAKVFLGVMRLADAMLDGAIADMMKVVMIEMLGDESMVELSMGQFGEGFGEVIVDMRNQVVIDDLKQVVEKEPQVKSIAILYGAAHMGDMAERLGEQLDYVAGDARWHPAIVVDFEQSAVPERELRQMRLMMRQALRMQMQGAKGREKP
jgi:general secretion pathway protein G